MGRAAPGRNIISAPFRIASACRSTRQGLAPCRARAPCPRMASTDADAAPPLQMGQAPGTHWYHAHKHGSTTINVANGMTGAFIIEGAYDDALNSFYSAGWTGPQPWARSQPVLVINQLGVSPNLFGGGGRAAGRCRFRSMAAFNRSSRCSPARCSSGASPTRRRAARCSSPDSRRATCTDAKLAADVCLEADRAGRRAVQRT